MGEHHPAQSTRRGICDAAEEGRTARYTREVSYNAPADGALHAVLGEHCAMWYPRGGGIHWTGLLDGGVFHQRVSARYSNYGVTHTVYRVYRALWT